MKNLMMKILKKVIASRTYEGTTGNLNLDAVKGEKERIESFVYSETKKVDKVVNTLTGHNFPVI